MISLEQKRKNLFNKNAADSYATYVSKNGSSAKNKYRAALEDAAVKQKLRDTDYGALADGLMDAGLNASGYEDYLRSRASAEYGADVGAAHENFLRDEASDRSGYAAYLSDYEAMQTKLSESLIKKISTDNNLSVLKA